MFAAASTGATLVLLEDPNPFLLRRQRALELLEQEKCTIFPGVPFNFRLMAEAPAAADLSSAPARFSAGTALPRPFFDAFLDKFGVPVRQLYGCTEAGTLTANMDDDPVASFESVGQPVDGVEVRIEDDDGEPVPTGSIGEVAVRSPGLTSGYADMEELNSQVFREGYFITGDLGQLDDEGRLTITGRKKLLIEVGGYKVDPIEVEDVVVAHPKVGEAVVVGVPGKVAGEEVVKAVVVPSDDGRGARADRVLPGAPRQLQGAAGRGVPRGDPEEPAREDPAQVPHLGLPGPDESGLLWKFAGAAAAR